MPTYYVKPTGGTGTGLDDANAWSFAKFNSTSLAAGDTVLFKCDGVYSGQFTARAGSAGLPITYSFYSTGAYPIIDGLTTLSTWTLSSGNIYYASLDVPALNMLTLDGVDKSVARFPKTGWLTYESHTANTSITDTSLSGSPNWTGGQVVMKKERWRIDKHTITSHSGSTITYSSSSGEKNLATPVNGNGYFFQNHVNALTAHGDWYYDDAANRLYMYFTGAPSGYVVKAASINNNVAISTMNYINFIGLDFRGSNLDSISLITANYINIVNCRLYQHGRNAIYGGTVGNCTVDGVTITDTYNNAIFYEYEATNNIIQYVTANNIGMVKGMTRSGDNAGTAIYPVGSNNTIQWNRLTNIGYCGINFQGSNTLIENNFVDGFCYTKDDGGGIYTVGNGTPTGIMIRKNIVRNGQSSLDGAAGDTFAQYGKGAGIYIDDFATGITVDQNVVSGCSWGGIFVHNASNLTITNNLSYDNKYAFHMDQYAAGNIRNVTRSGNIFIAKGDDQMAMYVWMSGGTENAGLFGTSNSNIYGRPANEALPIIEVVVDGVSQTTMTLAQWKTYSSQDAASTLSANTATSVADILLVYNDTAASAAQSLGGYNYEDVFDVNYPNTVTLGSMAGKLLFKRAAFSRKAYYNPVTGKLLVNPVSGDLLVTT